MTDPIGVDGPTTGAASRRAVIRYTSDSVRTDSDWVTVEEPLEIRVVAEERGRRQGHGVAVTMRTPGDDLNLAAGFLVSEGVVRCRQDIWRIEHCRDRDSLEEDNVVEVHLAPGVAFDPALLSRNVVTSSACGICGRASIESVEQICLVHPEGGFQLSPGLISALPTRLEGAQGIFAHTGGIHAAALLTPAGDLVEVCEDVGRHNALDKLVGRLLARDGLPATDHLALVSGRASFELVQKCLLAGIPLLAAVGAPSSLAVDLARHYGMTLIGFLRSGRFNVYCGGERIAGT